LIDMPIESLIDMPIESLIDVTIESLIDMLMLMHTYINNQRTI
jgi:hypothetical protein